MKITEICDLLRRELYEAGYEYGFILDGKKYKPDMSKGFDNEYYSLSLTVYRVQDPTDTVKEKIGTCIDSVVVMKNILQELSVPYRIWLLYNSTKNKAHTILTFEAENKIVYLELTPQSKKECYGKEIIFNDEHEFISFHEKQNYDVSDITDKIIIGQPPDFLLCRLKK